MNKLLVAKRAINLAHELIDMEDEIEGFRKLGDDVTLQEQQLKNLLIEMDNVTKELERMLI